MAVSHALETMKNHVREDGSTYQIVDFDPYSGQILTSLCLPPYLAEGANSSGILLHAVGVRPDNKDVDVSLIYADYYFIEALLRYQKTLNNLQNRRK